MKLKWGPGPAFVHPASYSPSPCANLLEHIGFDFICNTEGQAQDLTHAKQVLYHYVIFLVSLKHILNMLTEDSMSSVSQNHWVQILAYKAYDVQKFK